MTTVALPLEDPRRADRVRARTPSSILDQIDARTSDSVFRAARSGPEAIERRIRAIDREWDLDRWMQLIFTVGAVATVGRRGRLWRVMARVQQAFMIGHAAFGWAPPAVLLRRLGVRTQKEIDTERGVLVELYHLLGESYDVANINEGTAARW
jgi:hypothetical protein